LASKRKLILQTVAGFGVILLAGFVMGAVLGYMEGKGQDVMTSTAVLWVVGAFAALTMLISLWVGLRWMSSIDEAAQEAHKWAWFWGGSSGMAVGGRSGDHGLPASIRDDPDSRLVFGSHRSRRLCRHRRLRHADPDADRLYRRLGLVVAGSALRRAA